MKKKLVFRVPTALAIFCVLGQFSLLGMSHPSRADDAAAAPAPGTPAGPGVSTTTQSSDDDENSATANVPQSVNPHEPLAQAVDEDDSAGKFSGTYYGIFYGPNISSPTSYQANQDGLPEADKPLMLKNFIGLGYNIADHIRITPTAYWQWMPTAGGAYSFQDPFVTLSDDAIISSGGWNLYSDLRYHAPLSSWSKAADLQGSVQSVQVLSYVPDESRFMMALYSSEREYFYGSQGYGDDLELYFGPNVNYQLSPTVQLTMLYEMNLAHVYQSDPTLMQGDGQDIEPGVSWDITDHINFHPYLNLYPTDFTLNNVGVGMLLYWQAF